MTGKRVLYWATGSPPSWRGRIALEEKGLEYTAKLVNFAEGENRSPEYLKLNPRGQVPTLVDDDIIVNESLGIDLYLQDAYPEPSFLPGGKEVHARVYQRFQESQNVLAKLIEIMHFKMRHTNASEAEVKEKYQVLKDELKFWESYVGDGYMAGPDFSLADVAVGPPILGVKLFGGSLEAFPKLAKYTEKIEACPSFQRVCEAYKNSNCLGKELLSGF
ncbi:hypothetical protein WJX75_005349 [Coccomyxa subellipsoidea]|uniref:Glutathione S-transferase n=1 Tax=Coccomyxa subellipsoidea TaxID=248742 RepID=A0ABR2YGG9_9CHLO